jgi:hypothetical protein
MIAFLDGVLLVHVFAAFGLTVPTTIRIVIDMRLGVDPNLAIAGWRGSCRAWGCWAWARFLEEIERILRGRGSGWRWSRYGARAGTSTPSSPGCTSWTSLG